MKLLATPADRDRLAAAKSAVLLVGSYDGSGNYGDVLQLAGALATVRALADRPLPVAVVEHETAAHHARLVERFPELFAGAAFAFFEDGRGEPVDGLCELPAGGAPERSVLHLYGGGYLNHWWAGRKIEHCEAAGRLAGGRALPVTASGLQVADGAIGPAGPAHEPLAGASWIGLRDATSLEIASANLTGPQPPQLRLTGDDAIPLIVSSGSRESAPVVNFHLNLSGWISDDPERLELRVVRLLCALADGAGQPLELQPVVAYEDPRISERGELERFFDRHADTLRAHDLTVAAPLDVLDDAAHGGLERFRRARMTVGCSYHVTLTSLLARIPAVLLSDNAYYDQKAAGLRGLFDLAPGLLGVAGTVDDAALASRTLADGAARQDLVTALGEGAERVVALHDAARELLLGALGAGLERSGSTPRDATRPVDREVPAEDVI